MSETPAEDLPESAVNNDGLLTVSAEEALAASTLPNQARLRLMPGNEESPIISLVADPTMVVGRSATEADFIAQFRPRSNVNDGRSRRIGRSQARLQWRHERLRIYEPDVVNPSLVLETPIRMRAALALPTTMVLAGEFAIRIRVAASHYEEPRQIEGWKAGDSTPMKGALVIQSLHGGVLPNEAALLVSDISVYLSSSGKPKILVSSADKPVVRFHRLGGQFWLETIKPDHVMTTASNDSTTGEEPTLRLLKNGMNVKIGEHAYTVQHYDLAAAQWSANDQTVTQA